MVRQTRHSSGRGGQAIGKVIAVVEKLIGGIDAVTVLAASSVLQGIQ